MRRGKVFQRFLAALLAFVMVLGYVPVTALAVSVSSKPSGADITNGQPFENKNLTGLDGDIYYRIPAMVTLKDGTLVAAADARWHSDVKDGGGIDTVVATSSDSGANWHLEFANYFGDNGNTYSAGYSTAFLDSALTVGADGQTLYMLTLLYPYGVALNGQWGLTTGSHTTPAKDKTGFDANGRLQLNSGAYYLGEYNASGFAQVFNSSTNAAVEGITVDRWFYIYNNGTKNEENNLFFRDATYKVDRTSFLYLTTSSDGGQSWSAPTLLNHKTTNEVAFLVGPGRGLTTTDGTIMFSTYSYNSGSDETAGIIFSTDNGASWTRLDAPKDMQSSESQLVQLDDNTIRMFFRNVTTDLCYVDIIGNRTSGYTFDSNTFGRVELDINSYTMLSAIKYPMTVDGGKTLILVSCPAPKNGSASSSSGRHTGKIFAFTVEADNSMKLLHTIPATVTDAGFGYSCMTVMGNNDVAILYEPGASSMVFKTFSAEELIPATSQFDYPGFVDADGNLVTDVVLKQGETQTLTFRGLDNLQGLTETASENAAYATATLSGTTLTLTGVAQGETHVTYTVTGNGSQVKENTTYTINIKVLGVYEDDPLPVPGGDASYDLVTGNSTDIEEGTYLIVYNNQYALANNGGSTRAYPVTVSNNKVTQISFASNANNPNESDVMWQFTKQGNGYHIKSSTYYLALNGNSTILEGAQVCTLTSAGNNAYYIAGYDEELAYDNGFKPTSDGYLGFIGGVDHDAVQLYKMTSASTKYTVNTTTLEKVIDEAVKLESYKDFYTEESYDRLVKELAEAQTAYNNTLDSDGNKIKYDTLALVQPEQDKVTVATQDLIQAIELLDPKYPITVTVEGGHGTASSELTSAPVGRTVVLSVTADVGYQLGTISYTCTPYIKDENGDMVLDTENATTGTLSGYQFDMMDGKVDIVVTFVPRPVHNITVTPVANGSVAVTNGSTAITQASEGSVVYLTLNPDAGYSFNDLRVTDAKGTELTVVSTGVNHQYGFIMPESDVTVTATFKEIERYYKVTVDDQTPTLGTVTTDKTEALEGDIVTLSINPATGCYLSMLSVITVHGNPVGLTKVEGGNSYWFKMPKDDVVIASYFIEDDFISGLHMGKTAILQDDGTWTITLEAYATGNVTVQVMREVKPTDVIMILDQSGSMASDDSQIEIAEGFVPAGAVTNQDLINGGYYYYDKNDKTYYEIQVNQHRLSGEDYWTYQRDVNPYAQATEVTGAEDTWKLDNLYASGKIGKTVQVGNNVYVDVTSDGYLMDNYVVYQRTGSSGSRRYVKVTGRGAGDLVNQAPNPTDTGNNNQAYNNLVSAFNTDAFAGYHLTFQTASPNNTTYVIVYTAATRTNTASYEYVYYYEDAAGQLWEVGKSSAGATLGTNANLNEIYKVQAGGSDDRIVALRNAANLFLMNMRENAVENQVDHTVSIVGFASTAAGNDDTDGSSSAYQNTELFVGGTTYNFMQNGNSSTHNSGDYYTSGTLNATAYAAAMQHVNTENGYNALLSSVQALDAAGGTFPSHGFQMAIEIAKIHEEDYKNGNRDLVVVFMTDGSPGRNASHFSTNQARLINGTSDTDESGLAYILENTYNAEIQTVALLSDEPTEGSNVDTFLAKSATSGKYALATTGMELEDFFDSVEIGSSVSTETVTLSHNAYLVDRVSQYFNMPGNDLAKDASDADLLAYFQKYVKVGLAQHVGDEAFANTQWLEYVSGESATGGVVIDSSKADEETLANIHVWPTWHDQDGKVHGITAHSFDYTSAVNMVHTYNIAYIPADNNDIYDVPVGYVDLNASGICDTEEELATATDEKDGLAYLPGSEVYVNANNQYENVTYTHLPMGNKIVIEIKGVTAKDEAALNHYVYTNHETSGLWDIQAGDDAYSMVAAFPKPVALLVNRTYVLDYAKTAQLSAVRDVRSGLSLDSAKDGVFSGFMDDLGQYKYITALRTTDPDQPMKYGDIVLQTGADGYGKTFYTPKTMNWDGMDTFYVFWTDVTAWEGSFSDEVTGNGWTKINVIPANNIYYEDTFVSTETTDGGNATNTTQGTVGIVFSDGWTMDYSNEGDRDQNAEQPEDLETGTGSGIHGWVDELADDTGFSDGSAHVTDKAMATATFTFTGTGMDIYSRTNKDTGIIQVRVKPVADENGNKPNVKTSYYVVDNLAKSGDYYQIPTVAYTALDKTTGEVTYGTYEVKITVTNGAVDEGRMTFYLDGIRIYNPLGLGGENNPDVDNAYRDELKAVFTEVRDIILTNEDFNVLEKDPEYTITFDANGGTALSEDKQTTVDAKLVSIPTNVNREDVVTEVEGVRETTSYVFNGWYTAAEGGEKVTTDTVFEKDTTVYAQWLTASEVTNQYTITFDYNFEGEPEALTATTVNGKLVYVPHVEREGYVLDGWYDAESEGTSVAVDGEFTQDVTVYAIWRENTNDVDGGNAENKANTAIEGAVFIDWIKNEQSPDENEEGYHTYTVGVMDVFEKYGPKNEVYLEKGQSIVFKVDTTLNNKYFVGLKSLDGKAVVAEISGVGKDADGNATDKVSASFSHTTDMYYEIIPTAEGYISIKNESESGAILAITKLRTTNPAVQARTGGIILIEAQEATDFALKFAQMTAVTYNAAPEAPEGDTTEPEKPGDTPVEPELPDVEIENPEINPDPEPEEDKVAELIQEMAAKLKALVNKLFGSMRAWMNG